MNMKKAAIINAVGKYSQVIIQLLVSAVLSRILSADDYGIVAVVTVFSTFFATLSNKTYNVLHQRFLNAGPGAPECFVVQKLI